MVKKRSKAKSDTPKPRKQRGYRCIYRAFARLCGDRDPIDVLKNAPVGGNSDESRQRFLTKLNRGVPVEKSTFLKLAKELRCEPGSLYFMPEQMVPRWDSPAYQFAIRVAQLIEEKKIPVIDPDTKQRTDVVRYVWEMGDSELDSIHLTYRQERDAFMLLRDYLMQVVERPLETKRLRAKQLGAMEIGVVPKDDVIADVRAREATSLAAFDVLENDFEDNPFHINRIRAVVGPRVEMYLDAEALDQTQWSQRKVSETKPGLDEWELIGPQVNMELMRNVVEADFHVRKVIFPTYQQDIAFSAYYGRSRQLIEWVHLRSPDEFPTWWNQFKRQNTKELKAFEQAWRTDDHDVPPQWDVMRDALSENLSRTEHEILTHYPNDLIPLKLRNNGYHDE